MPPRLYFCRSDLKTQLSLAQRTKLLAEQRADRFEKQATQLSQKYQAVDLDVYNSLQVEYAGLKQQLAAAEAKVPDLKQQLADVEVQVQQLQQQLAEAQAQASQVQQEHEKQLQDAQVGLHALAPTPSIITWSVDVAGSDGYCARDDHVLHKRIAPP
jgi:chromosome segregation ATPase